MYICIYIYIYICRDNIYIYIYTYTGILYIYIYSTSLYKFGLCVASLRRGHANILCIVPILTDGPRRESAYGKYVT